MLTPGRQQPPVRGQRAHPGSGPIRLLVALVLLVLTLPGLATPASAARPRAARFAEEPLQLTLDQLSPLAIPRRGALVVSGVVTNTSSDVWTDIGLYPLTSPAPMTTPAELSEALASDPALPVGDRITSLGPLDVIDRLEPGDSAPYTLRVPRRLLQITGEQGVYWFAVQALGAVDGVRDEGAVADGRVRTFVPLISPRERRSVALSLVVPLRRTLAFRADGRVADVEGWAADLSPDGRLSRMLAIGENSPQPITWLVDPAVIQAVAQIADHNPGYNLGDFDAAAAAAPSSSTDPSTGSEDPSPGGDPSEQPAPPQQVAPRGATDEQAKVADTWLRTFRSVVAGDELLALPFGDLDVAAASTLDPDTYALARAAGSDVLKSLDLVARPAVAPLSGTLPADALPMLDPQDLVLLTPGALTEIDGSGSAYAAAESMRVADRLIVRSPWVPEGPAPGDPRMVVGTRQLLAAEAALTLIGRPDDPRPSLTFQLPSTWEIADAAPLFAGWSEQSWLTLRGLDGNAATAPSTDGPLTYPDRQIDRQLDPAAFSAAHELHRRVDVLGAVLLDDQGLAPQIARSSLAALSYADRNTPYVSRLGTAATTDWLNRQFDRITVTVPRSLLVPGKAGRLPVSVRNGLNHTVRVKVAATGDTTMSAPATQALILGPGESLSPVLQVNASGIGIHYLTVDVADVDGNTLTSSRPVPVRSTVRVGGIVWAIMGVGAALLFTAIAIRLSRRFLAWRRTR